MLEGGDLFLAPAPSSSTSTEVGEQAKTVGEGHGREEGEGKMPGRSRWGRLVRGEGVGEQKEGREDRTPLPPAPLWVFSTSGPILRAVLALSIPYILIVSS